MRILLGEVVEAHDVALRQLDEAGDPRHASTDGWRQLRLADVCDVLAGFSGSIMTARRLPAGVPVVTPGCLVDNRISAGYASFVAPTVAVNLSQYRLKSDDIVCVRTGQLGRQALVTEEQDGWLIGTSCLCLRPGDSVDSRYLLYYLNLHRRATGCSANPPARW
ncbi:restriction endonuclease subunit S [Parafrankia sp. FMc2]|uniref:restriction endonuclease subunit S n=1 Tax=Parafrankia sp. FMc2 TaxID=3233196 RepID=UPI0034D59716